MSPIPPPALTPSASQFNQSPPKQILGYATTCYAPRQQILVTPLEVATLNLAPIIVL